MTTASHTARMLSPRTTAAYAGDWALFTDWCSTTGERELPADPDTVLSFLTDCPAAAATQRRRVAAIDHRHSTAGYPRPGESPLVRAALGRSTGEPPHQPPAIAAAVETAMRALPSSGWTRGMFGRRDRCLLVLSQAAGVPYRHLATLTAGDITMADGTARVENAAGGWVIAPDSDPVLCGPCAITRWLRLLDLVVTHPSNRDTAQALKKAQPVTSGSPHLCRSTRALDPATLVVPLLPPIDQWGYVPFPVRRLTPHSLSTRARDLLAGDVGAHRDLPVDTDDEPEQQPAPSPVATRVVYSRDDAQRAWERRRADLKDIAGVSDVLDEVDARAKELHQRTAAILAAQTDR